jgi:hypothetical protein
MVLACLVLRLQVAMLLERRFLRCLRNWLGGLGHIGSWLLHVFFAIEGLLVIPHTPTS